VATLAVLASTCTQFQISVVFWPSLPDISVDGDDLCFLPSATDLPCSVQYGWYITQDSILNAAKGLVDTTRKVERFRLQRNSLLSLKLEPPEIANGVAAMWPHLV
jgi:hypothetical protein